MRTTKRYRLVHFFGFAGITGVGLDGFLFLPLVSLLKASFIYRRMGIPWLLLSPSSGFLSVQNLVHFTTSLTM